MHDARCTCMYKLKGFLFIELFSRLSGAGLIFNDDGSILRGWNGTKPWIIVYNHLKAEVNKIKKKKL